MPLKIPISLLVHSAKCSNDKCNVLSCFETKKIVKRVDEHKCSCHACRLCKFRRLIAYMRSRSIDLTLRKRGKTDNDNCSICLEHEKTHIYGCGHQCVCAGCLVTRCPICRYVGKPFKVYY